MNEIGRILPGDGRQSAEIHQEGAIPVNDYDLAVGKPKRDPQRDRRGEPQSAWPEVPIARSQGLPLPCCPARRDYQRIPSITRNRLQIVISLHHFTPKTLFVSSTATGFLESSARIWAPRSVSAISSVFLRI